MKTVVAGFCRHICDGLLLDNFLTQDGRRYGLVYEYHESSFRFSTHSIWNVVLCRILTFHCIYSFKTSVIANYKVFKLESLVNIEFIHIL